MSNDFASLRSTKGMTTTLPISLQNAYYDSEEQQGIFAGSAE